MPLGVHVGSVTARPFIEEHQPLVTPPWHVHGPARLTGAWFGRPSTARAAPENYHLADGPPTPLRNPYDFQELRSHGGHRSEAARR